MKRVYVPKRFSRSTMATIVQANEIIEEYRAQGFDLTLRQLYYQFVARDLIPNKQRQYDRLGRIVSDARLAGYIDWLALVDRTRNLRSLASWEQPSSILESAITGYRRNLWNDQDNYVEVWIEKDALLGVIAGVCDELDVPYFSCRGYTSQSEMWSASQRIIRKSNQGGRHVTILHLGDHDPSGVDMSRDIEDRLRMFTMTDGLPYDMLNVNRIALTMEQIEEYDPPPNPTKLTDSRASSYIFDYGYDSWELDALEPTMMADLIRSEVEALRDDEVLAKTEALTEEHREALAGLREDLKKRLAS